MAPASQEQWAFRAWTALQSRLSISPNHGMICGITSANSGDGRSTWISLLSRAARSCGFRVLTIIAQPFQEIPADSSRRERLPPPATPPETAEPRAFLTTPGQIAEQLTSEECPPVVTIPLPGWIWNLERRKQWRSALEAWRSIDHLVILVELPPAFVAESVLLAENIPNLLWLVDGCRTDASETLVDLETLRHASCNLVGAVLNRERADDCLECARRTQGMAGRTLGRAAGGSGAKDRCDRKILGAVVADGRGTVQVDVVDVAGRELKLCRHPVGIGPVERDRDEDIDDAFGHDNL